MYSDVVDFFGGWRTIILVAICLIAAAVLVTLVNNERSYESISARVQTCVETELFTREECLVIETARLYGRE